MPNTSSERTDGSLGRSYIKDNYNNSIITRKQKQSNQFISSVNCLSNLASPNVTSAENMFSRANNQNQNVNGLLEAKNPDDDRTEERIM